MKPPSFRQVLVGGVPAVALAAGPMEAIVLPVAGGRVAHLRRAGGREWLRPGPEGGLVERLVAAPAGALDAAADRWAGAEWRHDLRTTGDEACLTSEGALAGVPLVMLRECAVSAGRLRLRYHLRHVGTLPVAWSWQPSLTWTSREGTAVQLTGTTQLRVAAAQGREDLEAGDLVAWPGAIGGSAAGFTMPAALPWSVRCHGDLGTAGTVQVEDPHRGETLTLRADPHAVPHLMLALGAGDAELPPTLDLAPRIGIPDSLVEAAALDLLPVLEPGDTYDWQVDLLPGAPA